MSGERPGDRPLPMVGGQMVMAAGTDPLATAGLTLDIVRRAGRLGVPLPTASPDGYGLVPAEILEGLSDLADYDPSQALDPVTGRVLEMHLWPPVLRRALASLSIETRWEWQDGERVDVGTITKIKFAPRTPAYALLAKFRGMEPKTGAGEVLEDLAALVRDARQRAKQARSHDAEARETEARTEVSATVVEPTPPAPATPVPTPASESPAAQPAA